MPPRRITQRSYDVCGTDVESLREGFAHIHMPPERWDAAVEIVREVLAANDVSQFYWYKPPRTAQLCGYWDDAEVNMIWISPSEVHIQAQTPRPRRAPTTERAEGTEIGWLLPGGRSGSGGGRKQRKTAVALCPTCSIHVVPGSECMLCGFQHS